MKSDQSVKTPTRGRRSRKSHIQPPEPMVDPNILARLQNQGLSLHETSIEVLKLRGCESRQLRAIGIFTLEQLASTNEDLLRMIPHFGITKVRKLKARLDSYLAATSNGVHLEFSTPPPIQPKGLSNTTITNGENSRLSSTCEFISELEAASESLDKLKKRLRTYVAEIKKSESPGST
jgi:hypothetical protein